MKLRDLKKTGEVYFKRVINGKPSKTIYFVNYYERSLKKYSVSKYEDVNYEVFLKADAEITIDFIF